MADGVQDVYDTALTEFLSGLDASDRRMVQKLERLDSVDSFLHYVEKWSDKYSRKRSSVCFERLRPTLDWLWSFNKSVQSFLQASPAPFVLLWGSLSIILQLCHSYSKRLDLLVDCLEAVRGTQPRFELYNLHLANLFGGSLRAALVHYHQEVLHLFCNSIKFFQKPSYKNFWHTSFRGVRKHDARLHRLHTLADNIDKEANSTGYLRILELIETSHPTHWDSENMLLGAIPCENLPPRNNSFFGRHQELAAIESALRKDGDFGGQSVALYGLPGSGKSQLAAEYAWQKFHDESYEVVLWMYADTELKLAESVGYICKELGILDQNMQHDRELQKQRLLHWLRKTSKPGQRIKTPLKWLVVLDDVSDKSLLKPYWDILSWGAAIITCRSPEIASQLPRNKVYIDTFDAVSGSSFLLALTNMSGPQCVEEAAIATSISGAVGNHPLVLNVIGRHIRRCGKSLQHFLDDNPTFERDFIFRRDLNLGVECINKRTLSDVFALNAGVVSVLSADPESRLLLCLLVFLDPNGAPVKLFYGHTRKSMLCEGPDDLDSFHMLSKALDNPFEETSKFDRVRINLIDLSLIKMDHNHEKIKCHRLIQLATEQTMSSEEISLTLNKLVFFLNSAFPAQLDGQPLLSQWQKCDEFAGSVVATLASCMRHKDIINQPLLLMEVVCRCSWYYYEHGWFRTATKLADQAISYCEYLLVTRNHCGYTSWYVKDMISHHLNTKGTVGMKIPQADYGLNMYSEALRIRMENKRESNAEDEMWISAAMGNLAFSLMGMGKAEEALPKLQELVHREDMKTNEDIYLSNLCLCFYLIGRFDEALETSRTAARCIRSQWGDKDPRMAKIFHYIANVRESMGDYDESQNALNACLEIRENKMPLHQTTGLTHHRMGVFLRRRGSVDKAIEHLLEALNILSSCECHPGAVCRTILELNTAVQYAGVVHFPKADIDLLQRYQQEIQDVESGSLGNNPADYDRFVAVSLR